jgi:hypothetical protein
VDYVEAVEEILPKFTGLDRLLEVTVGGCDDSSVERHLAVPTYRPHTPFLEGSQQLGLYGGRHLTDFVEKKRAPVGFDEQTRSVRTRVGERTSDVTEELALE